MAEYLLDYELALEVGLNDFIVIHNAVVSSFGEQNPFINDQKHCSSCFGFVMCCKCFILAGEASVAANCSSGDV